MYNDGETKQIVVFGVGEFWEHRKELILNAVEVLCFIDNDDFYSGSMVEGRSVYKPEHIIGLQFDYVILMSLHASEMKKQLVGFSVQREKILYYEEFLQIFYGDTILFRREPKKRRERSILIATPNLKANGAAFAAIRAAEVLTNQYDVTIVCAEYSMDIIERLSVTGIGAMVFPAIYTLSMRIASWMEDYSAIIFNTIYMLESYNAISKSRSSMLWIHDRKQLVSYVRKRFDEKGTNEVEVENVYAVSKTTRQDVLNSFPMMGNNVGIMPYGIPEIEVKRRKHKYVIFAIIGNVFDIKGQDIFLQAVKCLPNNVSMMAEFWIIGRYADHTAYIQSLISEARPLSNVVFKGMINNEELRDLYNEIDVVVSASREDPLPMVLAEGMRSGSVCISSDRTGIASFITDGINGFIFENENHQELSKKMQWIILNRDKLEGLGRASRKIYEREFSSDVFKHRLYEAIRIDEK